MSFPIKRSPILSPVPREQWPDGPGYSSKRQAVWLSTKYLVQIFAEADGHLRLSIQSVLRNRDGNGWKDGLTWDELQAIKTAVGYGEKDAVEIYPRDKDVVNVANIRHLWVLPSPLAYAWRSRT